MAKIYDLKGNLLADLGQPGDVESPVDIYGLFSQAQTWEYELLKRYQKSAHLRTVARDHAGREFLNEGLQLHKLIYRHADTGRLKEKSKHWVERLEQALAQNLPWTVTPKP